MGRFLRSDKIGDVKLPLVKIRKNKAKNKKFLISTANHQRYKNLPLDICFMDDKCDEIS